MNIRNPKKPRLTLHCVLLVGSLALASPVNKCIAQAPSTKNAEKSLAGNFSGKVLETLEAAGYTYVQVDTGKAKVWAATPRLSVKVGDTLAVGQAMPMRNYHSKSLDRDFEVVYFTAETKVNGELPAAANSASALPKDHPPITGTGSPSLSKPKLSFTDIKKAEGGKRISEVFADKTSLSGKGVKIRGRVVKFNANIMGKNWIHIQDGTGERGSDDLTVTSKTRSKVGDLILVEGKVTTERDFGGSYQYAVIIEDAKVTVE